MTTTIPATALAIGDVIDDHGIVGEILEVKLVLNTPFYPEGYVDVLLETPRTPQGATRRWASFELTDQVEVI